MIDPTPNEQKAMEAILKPLGEYVVAIGMDRPVSDYSKAEVLAMIDVIITAFFEHREVLSGKTPEGNLP